MFMTYEQIERYVDERIEKVNHNTMEGLEAIFHLSVMKGRMEALYYINEYSAKPRSRITSEQAQFIIDRCKNYELTESEDDLYCAYKGYGDSRYGSIRTVTHKSTILERIITFFRSLQLTPNLRK